MVEILKHIRFLKRMHLTEEDKYSSGFVSIIFITVHISLVFLIFFSYS